MTHPILPLYDPPDSHPCMTQPTPAWCTSPLHDPPHPFVTNPTLVWPTPPLYDPPHPCMIQPIPAWPTPPLHDPPHPYWGPLTVDMQPYGCFIFGTVSRDVESITSLIVWNEKYWQLPKTKSIIILSQISQTLN